jgi:3-hydroxyisobutyrate dehydrogenase-like beta-hydroxyacid dehydrogenase
MDIGFIGLGNMGFPMARRLVEAGHQLTVFDTRKEAIERLTALGAQAAGSAAHVGDKVETVMVSLPTPDIVLDVATSPGGVAAGKKVRRLVDLSTTGAAMAKRIAAALAKRNIVQIDSPVSGGVAGAEKGTLAVMVSGPRNQCELVKPALEVIGKYFYIGDRPGAGQTMKLINNMLSATAMAATAEVTVMGAKAGLDPAVMIDVLNAGSGRNTATEGKLPRAVLTGKFDWGFTTGLMAKDVRLCLEEAEALGISMEISKAVRDTWLRAVEEIGAESDLTQVIQPMEQRAGVKVRAKK